LGRDLPVSRVKARRGQGTEERKESISVNNKTPTMKNTKPKIETKSVKHTFTPEEIMQLNGDFRRSYDSLKSVEAEFDSVKATYKAKTTEAESRMETLSATLNAGFEMRQEKCRVVLTPKESKKYYFLEASPEDSEPVLIEPMTPADFQAELIEAEGKFELREEIPLFAALGENSSDNGTLIIGRLNKLWYAALRVNIGTRILGERLDSEQPANKKRFDAVKRGCKRFDEWVTENLGKDEAKGFQNGIADVLEKHKEREE
jgi:hypothetical protein